MIESSMVQELLAERRQRDIPKFLEKRFGPVPAEVSTAVRLTVQECTLDDLVESAASCTDLAAFRAHLHV